MTTLVFYQTILNWYHHFGRKTLPWQIKKNPYKTWISEIMLQQTQVKTVIPYYCKFIKRFPNIDTLSDSPLDSILNLWSGLGYYTRARNIYKTAKILKQKFNGIFPNSYAEIIKLPGIGKSTAGAILSFGFNLYSCILDGNIKRVLIRYYSININNKYIEKLLWKTIESITPIYHTNKFNQALIDIGALICLKSNPKCNICPLKSTCKSYLNNKLFQINCKKNKKHIIPKTKYWFLILQYKNYIFLEKRQNLGIWKKLFCFPQFIRQNDILSWIQKNNTKIKKINILNEFKHKLSHLTLYINPIWIIINKISIFSNNNKTIWYNLNNPQCIGLPTPVTKIITKIKKFNTHHE
ncbi:A/G-specific adenine glycosylase [Buchnera aphidicola str. Bp (Baizongia pistaciae)]|uniref:Adenine DNA glycosylase n=1 Tax=Buchnera aphidicola subsp. Baizongia pistaciae (strain Bp) TaxID=224915 RepID=MUTY_BUCBP|nr:A/G-specific adenine glycosylase [Buchnera aphidicola]Q89A45.1 RecName: Full=Adenine DNA glycosylase [Buchnera aphidicola str. Bp (Baizongia pistaciae)]AAO27205.1 A/G-specific adenine glycosylase [Buchnera aphidicola str. Bp (Baizongia pistaciae)]